MDVADTDQQLDYKEKYAVLLFVNKNLSLPTVRTGTHISSLGGQRIKKRELASVSVRI